MSQAPSDANDTSRASESYMQLAEDQLQYFSNGVVVTQQQQQQRGNTLGIRLPGDNGGLVCPHDEKRQNRFQRPPISGQKPEASDYYNKYFNQNQPRGLSASEVTSQRSETSRSNRILAPQQGDYDAISSRASESNPRGSSQPAGVASRDQYYYANEGSQRPSSRPSGRQSATPSQSQRSQLGGSQAHDVYADAPSRQSESMRSSNRPPVSKDQYYSSHHNYDAPSEASVHLYEVDDVNRLGASDVPKMDGEERSLKSASQRSAPRSQHSASGAAGGAPRGFVVDDVAEPATFASRHSSQTANSSIRSEPDKTRPRLQSDAKPTNVPANMYQEPGRTPSEQSQRSHPDVAAAEQPKSNASSRRLSDVRRTPHEGSVRSVASSGQPAPSNQPSRPLSGSRQQQQQQQVPQDASVRSGASSNQPSRPLSGSRQQQVPHDASVRSGAPYNPEDPRAQYPAPRQQFHETPVRSQVSSAQPGSTPNQSRPLSGSRQQQQQQPLRDASVRSGASSAQASNAPSQQQQQQPSRPLSGSRQQQVPQDASVRSGASSVKPPASNQQQPSRPLSGSRQHDASMHSAGSYNPEDPRAQYPVPTPPPRSQAGQSGTPSRASPVPAANSQQQERSASQASATPVRMSSEADIREVQSDSPYQQAPRRASKALWENSTEGDEANCTFQPKINRPHGSGTAYAVAPQPVGEDGDDEENPAPAPVFSRLYADAQRYNRQRAEREKAIEMQQQMQRGEIPYDAEALRRAGLPAEDEEEFVVQQPRRTGSERADGQRDTAAPGDEPARRPSVSFEVFERLSRPINVTMKYDQVKELKEQQRQEEEKRTQDKRKTEMQEISNYVWSLPGSCYTMADLQRQNALFVA